MKIALLGPIAWRTPPRAYGPWEQVVSLLAEGLVERGVDVTLFATLDSQTKATLDGVCPQPYNESDDLDGRIWEALHVAHVMERSGEFDLVHNHLDWLPLAFSGLCRAPMLTTIHGFSDPRILPAYRRSTSAFVSISSSDRAPGLPYVGTVHHGLDMSQFPLGDGSSGNLVAFGRIHPDKATADAIAIARRAGMPLVICGPIQESSYFTTYVEPFVDGSSVRYLGNVGPAERAAILGGAVALLHPLGFDEPFGLSVVEAMACGTPVIGYPRGALPETVSHGVTGFLADGVAEAASLVPAAARLDRNEVFALARQKFSAARMVDDYLRIYGEVAQRRTPVLGDITTEPYSQSLGVDGSQWHREHSSRRNPGRGA